MALINRGPGKVGHRVAVRNIIPVGLIAAGLALGAATTATVSSASTTKSKSVLMVKELKNAKLGTVLVTTKGFTLYRYTLDTASKVACTGGCATAWPPLVLPSGDTTPLGGSNLSGLGTIKDANGKLQVTFKGHPLYTFAGDKKAGATNGQGSDGTWFAVTSTTAEMATAKTASSNSGSATTVPASSGGYGY